MPSSPVNRRVPRLPRRTEHRPRGAHERWTRRWAAPRIRRPRRLPEAPLPPQPAYTTSLSQSDRLVVHPIGETHGAGKGFADRKAARGDRARRLCQVRPARRGHRVVGHRPGARGSGGPVGTRERVCHRHRFARQRAHAACARGAGRRVRSTGPLGPQGQAPARRRRREHDPCLQPVRPYACGGRHRHRSAAPEGDRWGAGAGVSTGRVCGRVCDASRW